MAKRKRETVFFGGRWSGISQLTLVEHALCPLVSDGPFEREAKYFYGADGKQHVGKAEIKAIRGLIPEDDFYLWGLLALTLSQPEAEPHLYVSARYMLRQLGLGEGGKNLVLLQKSLERLSGFDYKNDHFYDPIKKSHRRVAFGFLKYDIPLRNDSIQGWHIYWDQKFFELCKPIGGFLGFDLQTYRSLKPADRRLFLFLSKYFYSGKKRPTTVTPYLSVDHLCVEVLGYAKGLAAKSYNQKLKACVARLAELGIILASSQPEQKTKGKFRIRFVRGPYFDKKPTQKPLEEKQLAVYETLSRIGITETSIPWMMREFPVGLINQWADVTFAAIEHGHVQETPPKFFVYHIKKAKAGEMTPPDWYREIERQQERARWHQAGRVLDELGVRPAAGADEFERYIQTEGRQEYAQLVRTMVQDYSRSGIDASEAAAEAEKYAKTQLRRKYLKERQGQPRRLI